MVAYGREEGASISDDATPIGAPAVESAPTSAPLPVGDGQARAPATGRPGANALAAAAAPPQRGDAPPSPTPARRWRWADLLRRVFAVDVLRCPNCGGRMRVLATIDDPDVVRRILAHLGLAGGDGPPTGNRCRSSR